jgi:hypothetical protein
MNYIIVCFTGLFLGYLCGFIFGEFTSYSREKNRKLNDLDGMKELLRSKEEHIKFLQAELEYERKSNIDVLLKEDNNENCITKN